jgi:two-component system chemotaxis response regulator CheB
MEVVRERSPSVIVMDFGDRVGADGLIAIESVMAEQPTPILVLFRQHPPDDEAFLALDRGALDLLEWPDKPTPAHWQDLSRRLVLLSQVRVVQHVRGKHRQRTATSQALPAFPLVAIASSLGGPKALSHLLSMLPSDFPAPIVICQHISSGFTEGLARWLSTGSALEVIEGEHGASLRAGTVYLAPSGAHLQVSRAGKVVLDPSPAINGFRPSCDALLESVAEVFARRAIGLILTGMGRDGAAGLKQIRLRGGRTIAQDEASSAVFGMPREAIALGAAEEVLPLDQIAAALVRLVQEC